MKSCAMTHEAPSASLPCLGQEIRGNILDDVMLQVVGGAREVCVYVPPGLVAFNQGQPTSASRRATLCTSCGARICGSLYKALCFAWERFKGTTVRRWSWALPRSGGETEVRSLPHLRIYWIPFFFPLAASSVHSVTGKRCLCAYMLQAMYMLLAEEVESVHMLRALYPVLAGDFYSRGYIVCFLGINYYDVGFLAGAPGCQVPHGSDSRAGRAGRVWSHHRGIRLCWHEPRGLWAYLPGLLQAL